MYHYELTERGKIVIAVVLVILLLLVPSAVLLCTAMARQPSHPPEQPGLGASESPLPTHVVTLPPISINSPPPNGGGSNAQNVTPPANGSDNPSGLTPPANGSDNSSGLTPPANGSDNPSGLTPPANGSDNPSGLTPPANGGEPETQKPGSGQEPSERPGSGPTGGNPAGGTLSFLFSPHLQNTVDSETSAKLDEFIDSLKSTSNSLVSIEMPKISGEDAERVIAAVTNAFAARGIAKTRLEFITKPAAIVNGAYEVHLSFIPLDVK